MSVLGTLHVSKVLACDAHGRSPLGQVSSDRHNVKVWDLHGQPVVTGLAVEQKGSAFSPMTGMSNSRYGSGQICFISRVHAPH